MNISLNFLARIAGMIVLAYVGNRLGVVLASTTPSASEVQAIQLLTLAGAGLGLLTTHRWTIEPAQQVIEYLQRISIDELLTLVAGALGGLLLALLLAVPIGYLPAPFGQFLPICVALLLGYAGALLFSRRRKEVSAWFGSSARAPQMQMPTQMFGALPQQRRYLVDTSAIIDGRIAQVSETGFLDGTLLVPQFVLNELQTLADSSDPMRRAKGRRGLEMLNSMQKDGSLPVEVVDTDLNSGDPVDNRLIALALQFRCPLITNDFNLGRVAQLQTVRVLSLNQLSDAVRPPVIPGQDIQLIIRDAGREREQGISFLEDGTMVVVEEARRLVGREITATVTRIHQTQTGRIVFAHLASTNRTQEPRNEPAVRSH